MMDKDQTKKSQVFSSANMRINLEQNIIEFYFNIIW